MERIALALGVDLGVLCGLGEAPPTRFSPIVERLAALIDQQPAQVQTGVDQVVRVFIRAASPESHASRRANR